MSRLRVLLLFTLLVVGCPMQNEGLPVEPVMRRCWLSEFLTRVTPPTSMSEALQVRRSRHFNFQGGVS